MSVIQSLREKYLGLTVGLVIIALIGFLLMDSISNNLGSVLGGTDSQLASVDGEEITRQEFSDAYEIATQNYKQQNPDRQIDDATAAQIRSGVMQELIRNRLLAEEFEKIDLIVSDAELKYYMTSENAAQQLKQVPAFVNQQTGQFDGNLVKEYDRMANQPNNQNITPEQRQSWQAFKKSLREERKMFKYNALLSNSFYVPNFMAEDVLDMSVQMVKANVVRVSYDTIPEADIKVEDADLQKLINSRKELFRVREDGRDAEFVVFMMSPSSADSAKILAELNSKLEGLNSASDKVAYINQNSSMTVVDDYVLNSEIPNPVVQNAGVGEIVGPFFDEQNVYYTEVLDQKMVPDSVKAQHILLGYQSGKYQSAEQIQAMADSVYDAVKSGSMDFAAAAAQFSDDPSNSSNAGNLGYFGRGMMVGPFEDSAFHHKAGDLYTVNTEFGIHIVRVQDQKSFIPAKKLGQLAMFFQASDETKSKQNQQITAFLSVAKDAKSFDEQAKKMNLTKRIISGATKSSNDIPGLGPSRDANQWLFSHKKGDISDPMLVQQAKVVMKITGEQKKGYRKPEGIREQWSPYVMNQKKAEKLGKEFGAKPDLNKIAAKYGAEVLELDSISYMAAYHPVIGAEPKVIGYVFGKNVKNGDVSPPIPANTGVMVVQKVATSKVAEADKNQIIGIKTSISQRMKNSAYQDAVNTLIQKADVVDNLNVFY